MTEPTDAFERYLHGHHRSVVSAHSVRRASESAAFMLPELKSPMRLLDFGCGPGTITIDLAEHLLPEGSVVGIDMSQQVIGQARSTASERQIPNVTFEVNSVYETGYATGSFDAVYAHQVLQHLPEPTKALIEARRLLRPGGICGVREVDWGTVAVWPDDGRLVRFLDVYHRVAERNGGDADAGRHLKQWFVDAGFSDLAVTTSTWTFSEGDGLSWWGEQWAERIVSSNIATSAVEYGIATEEELAEISQGWLDWIQAPGAFFAFTQVEVVGRQGPGG
ncbi:MAG: methyltransferase domain-containing protein [Dehalococcoidia bacterium]|jgi:ubiquinone/menaquinone biosynthesis C-methylase UbiE|nr:methyltransferase domain-containing protein [Dehalococcoidia bacterium]